MPDLKVIGWREWVHLVDFDIGPVKAKVDTGARTSTLHAFGLREFERHGVTRVRFDVHPHQRSSLGSRAVECVLAGRRSVRSSSGTQELRPVIETTILLAGRRIRVELTLTRRDEMGFRMLIGRAAVRRRFIVDPGRSYVGGRGGATCAS